VDRFTGWVDRRPGPSWLYFAVLGLGLLLVQLLVLWIEGAFPTGTFFPGQVFMAGITAYLLATALDLPLLLLVAQIALQFFTGR
jgi:hypothetical protein